MPLKAPFIPAKKAGAVFAFPACIIGLDWRRYGTVAHAVVKELLKITVAPVRTKPELNCATRGAVVPVADFVVDAKFAHFRYPVVV